MKTICALIATNSDLKFLKPTIESIKNQTRKLDKIILINDNGKYKLKDLKKILNDTEIPYKLINNKINKGLTKSLNIGISFCKEDYIARADSGDIWHIDKIRQQEIFLKENQNIVCVGSQCGYFVDSINKINLKSNFPYSDEKILEASNFIGISPASHSSILIRSQFLKYNPIYKRSQDLDLYLRLISSGRKITNINKVLSFVYSDPNGISINNKPSQLRYIYRAHHNYQCRINQIKENNSLVKDFMMFDYFWFFAKPIYRLFVTLDIKKYRFLKVFLLFLCCILYPPLIPFYLFRIKSINKLRLFSYKLFK